MVTTDVYQELEDQRGKDCSDEEKKRLANDESDLLVRKKCRRVIKHVTRSSQQEHEIPAYRNVLSCSARALSTTCPRARAGIDTF